MARAAPMRYAPAHLSLVVPAHQEADGLERNLEAIRAAALETGLAVTLIVVDDGSTDGTWEVLARMATRLPELVAVRLSRHFGKEAAICAGIDRADGDACIVLDADLQHPPALIPEMVRRWREDGWDVVEAVKSHRGRERRVFRWTTRVFYHAVSMLSGQNLQDASDFKLLDRRVVGEWRRLEERATFFRGLVSWMGMRRTQLFFEVPPRKSGQSSWSLAALAGLALRAVTSFSALPLQLVTVFGVLTLLLAFGIGAQALRLWLDGQALPGFTTVILLQLIIGGFLMVSLGIIGTYLARIYEEVKGRPRYLVQESISSRTARVHPAAALSDREAE
jgi:polyisoprenyl-phosphate glycosyltransferase